MEPLPLNFIAGAARGRITGTVNNPEILRICTDSRIVRRGDLFVAIPGEKFDGHEFLEEVFEKGAEAAVISRQRADKAPKERLYIEVEDPRRALGAIARAYRELFSIHSVAIAGSNGKTTTKELLASVLAEVYQTVSSQASFNNDVGVPLTIFQLGNKHSAGVFEVGTNHPGELGPLIEMVGPQIGIITSIGREHLEFFGDINGVIREEGTLAELMDREGLLLVNGDCPGVQSFRERGPMHFQTVGRGAGNDWRISEIEFSREGTSFQVECADREYRGEYSVRLLGAHQAVNAGLVIAAARELGLNRHAILNGLGRCRGAKMRLQLKEAGGVELLDDSYNANADSMAAALETLEGLPCSGRRVAVLGDMAELGKETETAHQEVGRRAAEGRIDLLVTLGKWRKTTAQGARAAGMTSVQEVENGESASEFLLEWLRAGDLVLVKASRSSRLETLVEGLLEKLEARKGQG